MTGTDWTLGIIGGTGMLGSAILDAVLDRQVVSPARLLVSNRRGGVGHSAQDFSAKVTLTTRNQEVADTCDVILLSVPPSSAASIAIDASEKLVISVMAGVPLDVLARITGADRIIRAMSSPAARDGLAYSPWCARVGVTREDRARAAAIFAACGLADEVESEAHIEYFTAMTGPVPGFVSFYAKVMVDYAVSRGIDPEIADRAIRQLFLSAGTLMSAGAMTPADHVKQMIDYAGTTAAGLETMGRSSIGAEIAEGLDAAVARARAMG